jgi:alkylated DNA repair dioxygenase AlkB
METSPDVLFLPNFLLYSEVLFPKLVASIVWDERLRARKTASFGVPYNYGRMVYSETPLPEILLPLVEQLTQTLGFVPNNCLINYYPDGHSTMGFHRDDTAGLVPETGVAIVSLGTPRTLVFRAKTNHEHCVSFRLPSGSLLYMPPTVQDSWQHGVPEEPEATGGRTSLTFRYVSAVPPGMPERSQGSV